MKEYFLTPRVIGGFFILFCLLGHATAQFSVGVAPPRFEFSTQPGTLIRDTLHVFSNDVGKQVLKPAVEDWLLAPTGELVVVSPNTVSYSATDWTSFLVDPFELDSFEKLDIDFTIDVPANLASGTYWTTLTLTTEPKTIERKGVGIGTVGRFAVILYIHVGELSPSGELLDFYLDENESGELEIVSLVQNTGNSVLRFAGGISFLDTSGEPTNTIELDERVVLREGLAEFRIPFPKDLPEDILLVNVLFSDEGSGVNLYGEIELP